MAALFKAKCQILRISLENMGYSMRYFNTGQLRNVHNLPVIPVCSQVVNNFGNLKVFNENFKVHVKGSNSWKGNQPSVNVSLLSDNKDALGCEKNLQVLEKCIRCDISNEDNGLSQVRVRTDSKSLIENFKPSFLNEAKLHIEIPCSYQLRLQSSSQSTVTVEKLECDNVEIHSQRHCVLSQLKSQLINVNSLSGDILSKSSLIGDLLLTTNEDGVVNLGKIQGNNIKIFSGNGDVMIASLYAGDVQVNTKLGNVIIGDSHGNIEVTSSSGNIKCGSISGLLKAYTKDGDIEAKLTLGGNLDATTLNGNAIVKLDSDLKCELELSSKTLNISSDLHILEKFKEIIDDLTVLTGQTEGAGELYGKVSCKKGNIDLIQEGWFVMPKN